LNQFPARCRDQQNKTMKVKLLKVRLSFPALFKPKSVNDSEPKYGASFLLSKKDDAAQIDMLRKACLDIAKEKWPAKIPAGVKYCVHDGAEKDYDGYGPAVMYISTSATLRPVVVDQKRAVVTEEDRKVVAGYYVNAVIRLWAQDNQYGKRINAQLQAVQLAEEGEAFGEKPIDPNEEFDSSEPTAAEPAFGPMGKPVSRPGNGPGNQPESVNPEDDTPF
jgi:hypothetical protein